MTLYDFGTGGYDIEFDCPDISSGSSIQVRANIGILVTDTVPGEGHADVIIGRDANGYYVSIADTNGTTRSVFRAETLTGMGRVRIVWHNEFCTVYVDRVWIHTFWFTRVLHDVIPIVQIRALGNITITNVRLKELADWREAIFIDMETTSQNAIGSVVLQRPIEMYPIYTGQIRFVYDPVRSNALVKHVRAKDFEETDTPQSASDAIVYFTNAAVVIDEIFAEEIGFVTRMYRFPDLDNGAVQAAVLTLKKSREQRTMHRIEARFSPRFELGDIANIIYTITGTLREVDHDIIIESISYNIGIGGARMEIVGRETEQ